MKYTVVIKKQREGGYTAQCLEVPGAISQGETKGEAVRNVREAIELVTREIRSQARTEARHRRGALFTLEVPA
jgi:predicted RNase H-like HicB family nuclease